MIPDYRIIQRSEWGARPPRRQPISIPQPSNTDLHHSAGPGTNEASLRGIQAWHMDAEGWSDIAYSHLIGNGRVYEGRGPLVDHLTTDGKGSWSICLMGPHHLIPVADYDILAAGWVLAHGLLSGWTKSEITRPHRLVPGSRPSICPGSYGEAAIPLINAEAARIIKALVDLTLEEDMPKLVRNQTGTRYYLRDGASRYSIRSNAQLNRLIKRWGGAEVWDDRDIDDLVPAGSLPE